jgi:replicative DNA helicase
MPEKKATFKNASNRELSENIMLPPQNIEAEVAVLGGIMIDPQAIVKIADILLPEDFYREEHRLIFLAALKLFENRKPIDVLTIVEELEKTKKLKEVGGAAYVSSLASSVASATNIRHYAEIVREKAVLRRIISAGTEIADLGYKETYGLAEIIDKAERKLFEVSSRFLKNNFLHVSEILSTSFDRIEKMHNEGVTIRGTPTGFTDLDNLLSGLQPSNLIILAARPSVGKTALALNIAENAAVDSRVPVAIFSLEMSRDELVDRMLCSQAGIDLWRLRTGRLSDEDFSKLSLAFGVLSEAPLYIDDTPMATVAEIRAKARRLSMELNRPLGLIVVDYLQLMHSGRNHGEESRVQEVSEISRGLKAMARDLEAPVLAISQLSRAVENRPDKRPQLADLRESGSIEQDSDVVIFIYREELYDKNTENKNIAEILVRKHRNGPIGEVKLYFKPEYTRFFNLELHHKEEPK